MICPPNSPYKSGEGGRQWAAERKTPGPVFILSFMTATLTGVCCFGNSFPCGCGRMVCQENYAAQRASLTRCYCAESLSIVRGIGWFGVGASLFDDYTLQHRRAR